MFLSENFVFILIITSCSCLMYRSYEFFIIDLFLRTFTIWTKTIQVTRADFTIFTDIVIEL